MIQTLPKLPDEFYHAISRGEIPGHSILNKFGAGDVGISISPVTTSLFYRTPTSATALEFISTSANDTAAGTGAQEITIIGLDSNYDEVTQTIATNGTTAVPIITPLTRHYRWYVSKSGSYADQTTGSHAGTLTIQESGGGATWAIIEAAPFPFSQSQIGVFTIPRGYTGFIISRDLTADSSKSVTAYMFQRDMADTVAAPFSAMRVVERFVGVNAVAPQIKACKGPFVGPCDLGFMASVSVGSAIVSVNFSLILIQDGF